MASITLGGAVVKRDARSSRIGGRVERQRSGPAEDHHGTQTVISGHETLVVARVRPCPPGFRGELLRTECFDGVPGLNHHVAVAELIRKRLDTPDETVEFPLATQGIVELGDLTVGRFVAQPGWRWSEHIRPEVGGEWCRVRHVGVVISGRIRVVTEDGTEAELRAGDVYDIPAGHDAYVIGDEPMVQIEWQGLRVFVGSRGGCEGAAW